MAGFGGSYTAAVAGGKPLRLTIVKPRKALRMRQRGGKRHRMSFASDGRGLDVASAPAPGERRKLQIRPLARLVPYVAQLSRARALAALAALIVAALTTLVVPVAVRRMIDFGFSDKAVQLIDSYFAVMIAVVAVLAVSSALALLPGDHFGRAHRRRSALRCIRASYAAVVGIFRRGAHRRNRVAAHRRHDADQIGRGRFGLDRVAQSGAVSSAAPP